MDNMDMTTLNLDTFIKGNFHFFQAIKAAFSFEVVKKIILIILNSIKTGSKNAEFFPELKTGKNVIKC